MTQLLGRPRQKDPSIQKFQTSLENTVRPHLKNTTKQNDKNVDFLPDLDYMLDDT
jgi:hypothetical protein